MAPHLSILAWKIPWTEEPGELQSMGSPRVRMTEHTHTCTIRINGGVPLVINDGIRIHFSNN